MKKFYSTKLNDLGLVFCIVDKTDKSFSSWAKEIVKNQTDYTISNLISKGYDVIQGFDEDKLLKQAVGGYSHAVVITAGTEFINNTKFIEGISNLIYQQIDLAGHILDRKSAYYELHEQCYYINLKTYRDLGCPDIGNQCLGRSHSQQSPQRSIENIHDDYTPIWILPGEEYRDYEHQCHGWNILSIYLSAKKSISIFDSAVRDNKIYLYQNDEKDFYKNLQWINLRYNQCATSFVHTSNTEKTDSDEYFEQILTPASGLWYMQFVKGPCKVIMYDYNYKSLDYWKENVREIKDVEYDFVHCDLLTTPIDATMILDPNKKTLINLSNIFCYEGTAAYNSLSYRIFKENQIIDHLKLNYPDAYINISMRAASGFDDRDIDYFGPIKNYTKTSLSRDDVPTWHLFDFN